MTKIVETNCPLSYGQQALWFIYQMAPENVAYNIFTTVKINSYLNIAAVVRVWKKIVEHHPILRTTYTLYEGKPVQQINDQQKFRIQVIDASAWSEGDITEQISAETDRPFNLEKDSVLRVHLFTRSEKEHILLLTMHHIAGDMWSFDLLLSEFQNLYATEIESASQKQKKTLAAPAKKKKLYTEFVRWQSEMLSDARGEKHWQYWQNQLAGELPSLNLLTDKPHPAVQTYRGASHLLRLDNRQIQRLNNLAQTSGKSLYRILLTAFFVQLYCYTNQEDILIGSPMRGRWGGDFQEIVGYFVNAIPLRAAVGGNTTFVELLDRVSNTVKEAQDHQDYPFSLLAEKLQTQRDLSRSPLCQAFFTWHRYRWCEATENSLPTRERAFEMEPYLLAYRRRGADFDLNLMVMEAQGDLHLCWRYSTDLFDHSTIVRMVGHFVTLLEGIVANPEARIAELSLLSQAERHQLLVEWNDTQTDYPQDKCLHQLFEEQVERTPNAVAVVFEDRQLTYQQLNSRANQLAHYLRCVGVEAETLVGLCMDRSLLTLVGMLGILKAGGAYVPLDPDYPQERLSFMLEDSQVSVLLTQEKFLESLPSHQAQVVCSDTDWEKIAQHSGSNPENTIRASHLAYVIYTSGSTGKPKGVLVSHSNVVRLFAATNDWYHFNDRDVWTLFHSYAFDFSVWEMWGALFYGGRLVVVPYLVTRSPESFYKLLCEEQVTVLNQTPSAFRQLIQAEQSIATTNNLKLRLVIFGGEALKLKSLQPWFERHGDRLPQLVNMYGITETTVHVTYRPLSQADLNGTASVIGRTIPDLQVYVLDRYLQPVPIGVPGEMYVGGAGVTRGYLNRDETAQRFISHPFVNDSEARLYKTGDLARYLPNGELEYLGRIDNQVKIRGFRIELGEIETLLAAHPTVWESVVAIREDEPDDKRLVAYVVAKGEQSPTATELRHFLKKNLPEYMLPNAIVVLESLPLTANGKVDRRALPAPDFQSDRPERYVAPRTPVEEMLAQVWAQVLKVEQVGVCDNFFELGGHSLLATQLVSRIRDRFKVELPLRELFGAATLAELAQTIGQLQQRNLDFTVLPILPRSKR